MSTLQITGAVSRVVSLRYDDLAALPAEHQIVDISRFDPKRRGDAVSLRGLLSLAGPAENAAWLGLHSEVDNFHASIPLASVLDRGFLVYRLDGQPLPPKSGGPFRFFIPDHAACKVAEVDECANVKFVERIELTVDRGHDNRPLDEADHAALHAKEEQGR